MDDIEIRKQAIIMYLAHHNPTEICETLKKCRPWFYKWVKRYKANPKGDWFIEHSRRPQVIYRLIDKDIENIIIQVRKHLERTPYAQIGAISIQWELRKLHIEPPPIWTIDRIIKKHNLTQKKAKISKRKNEYPDYSSAFTHQLDLVGPRYLQKSKQKYYFSNIIDTNTHCVHVNPIQSKASEGIINTIIRFWRQFGIPDYLQMDNELSFRGSNRHPHSFPSGVIRAGDWKLIEAFETGELSLFNLARDIGETHDVSGTERAKTEELHDKLESWRRDVGADPMRPNPEYRQRKR